MSVVAARGRVGDEGHSVGGGWPALIAAGLSVALILIDGFIISAAAPQITTAFNLRADHMGWLIAAYTLPLAVSPMLFGLAGDRFGGKPLFVSGMSLLIIASLLCAASSSLPELTFCRFLQGFGAAMLSPQTLAAAAQSLGAARRGYAIGIWGSVSSLGLLAGPVVGGVILAYLPWHAIFLMNVPLGLIALIGFVLTVPDRTDMPPPSSQRWPIVSAGLLLCGASLIVMSLGSFFRGDMTGLAGAAFGGLLLYLWFRKEDRTPDEGSVLIGQTLVHNGIFLKSVAAAFAMNASSAGTVAVLSLTVAQTQSGMPQSLLAGLIFMPAILVAATVMPMAGKLAQTHSLTGQRLLFLSVIVAIAAPLMIGWSLGQGDLRSLVLCAVAIACQGAAASVLLSFAMVSALVAAGPSRAGLGSGAISMARNLGTALGAAALTAAIATIGGPQTAFGVSALFAAFALPYGIFIARRPISP
ncbi:MAG: MFS transporter [Pseudomonadota bacterium]